MPKIDPLSPHRQKIDEIDENLLGLLNDRARVVLEIGKIKRDRKAELYAPAREQAIFARLTASNQGPFPNEGVRSVFREIISASLALEGPQKVAYLGPEATFTHMASTQRFGFSINALPVESIKGVFDEVERGRVNFGVVPIENSNEGVVNHTLDMFIESPLKIFGETLLEISHHLLSKNGKLSSLKRVYSHPLAFAQCKVFIESRLQGIEVVEVSSTAKAAEMAQQDSAAGAIASELAARLYHLEVIEKKIEDHVNNFTRFLVISPQTHVPTGRDKTSLLFSVQDKPGILYEIIRPFSRAKINLTNIESRPSKRKAWEYIFYVDMEGHVEDRKIRKVIKGLRAKGVTLKVLGSYPSAEEIEV